MNRHDAITGADGVQPAGLFLEGGTGAIGISKNGETGISALAQNRQQHGLRKKEINIMSQDKYMSRIFNLSDFIQYISFQSRISMFFFCTRPFSVIEYCPATS